MAKEKFNEEDGVWRTIGGRRVFIRNGQSLADAMKESGKFSRVAKNQELYKKVEEENKKEKSPSEEQLKKMQTEYKDVADLRDEYEDKILSKMDEEEQKEGKLKQNTDAQEYYSKLSEKEIAQDLEERKNRLDNGFYDAKDKEMYQKFYDEGKKYYDEKYGVAEVWEKQPDGTFLANKDAMKKQYEENHKNYDAKIKQFAEDRKNMTNGDWEGMLMAYEQQNADGTYKSLQDIMDDVDKYEKANDRKIKASMGEVDIPDNFEAQFNDYAKEQEEKERLDIAKDIAKEVYGLNEENASPERIEKEAKKILEPQDGEVLEKGEQPFTNSKGELERSTESLKKWRDDLMKTKEPRDELAEASGGAISTLKTSVPASKAERIKPGTEIYYKGDQANTPGYFTVESFDPSKEQFMSSITLKEKGGEGRTKKISAQQIEDSYTNNYASRFAFKEDYDNYRNSVFEGYAKKYGTKTENKSTNETMNNAIREKASAKRFPTTLSREIYNMDVDKGNAWSGNAVQKTANGEQFVSVRKNGPSQNSASDIANNIMKKYPQLDAKVIGDNEVKVTLKGNNSINDAVKEKSSGNQISNSLREKAYKKYLKEHPGSKISFEQFKDMRKQ